MRVFRLLSVQLILGASLVPAQERPRAASSASRLATEEAIYNSLFRATTVTSNGRTVEALPIERLREVLRRYSVGTR